MRCNRSVILLMGITSLQCFLFNLMQAGCARNGFALNDDQALDQGFPVEDSLLHDRRINFDQRLKNPDGMNGIKNDYQVEINGTVNAANDTCASPAVIDLSPLASGGSVTFTVDTRGANRDYQDISLCSIFPELIVKFINFPGEYYMSCSGEGSICTFVNVKPLASCPPTSAESSSEHATTCPDAISIENNLPTGTLYVAFYRDPSLPPATVTMSLP